MAQQFITEAVVRLVDQVSGPLSGLASRVRAQGQVITSATQSATQQLVATNAAAQAAYHQTKHSQLFTVGADVDKQVNNMAMFTEATKAQIATMQKAAQTQGAMFEEGPAGFMKAQMEALKSGVKIDAADLVATYGSMYARMAEQSASHGTREIIQHASMMREFKNSKGEIVGIGDLTRAELEKSMSHALGRLSAVTKNTTGWSMKDTLNFYANAGPAFNALQQPGEPSNWAQSAAMARVLSKSFKGDVSGNAVASMLGRVASPSGPARQMLAQSDMDWSKFATIDPKALNPEGFGKGVEFRVGSMKARARKEAGDLVRAYQAEMANANTDPAVRDKLTTKLRRDLIDVTKALGERSLNNDAKAGNLVNTFFAGAVKNVDLFKLLEEANTQGKGIGYFNSLFGKDRGKQAMFLAQNMKELRDAEKFFGKKDEEATEKGGDLPKQFAGTYESAQNKMENSFKGLLDSIFTQMKPTLTGMFDGIGDGFQKLNSYMSDGAKAAAGFSAVAAGALGTLSSMAVVMVKLGLVSAEGALATLLGNITSFTAGVLATAARLVPAAAVGAVAGHAVGKTIVEIGAIAAGKHYLPKDEETVGNLRVEAARLQEQINAIRYTGRNKDISDLQAAPLEAQLQTILNRITAHTDTVARNASQQAAIAEGSTDAQLGIRRNLYDKPAGPDQTVSNGPATSAFAEAVTMFSSNAGKPVQVDGSVNGNAEIMNRIVIEPSQYLTALISKAENAVNVALSGKFGTSMGGSNGPKPAAAFAGPMGGN